MHRYLHDLADVYYGKSPNNVLTEESLIPVIGTGGVYGRASCALFNGPAVVVPRKGSLSNPQYITGPFWPVDTTYALIPKAGVDAKWLYYSLCAFDLTKLNEATGVPSISRDWLYKIPLGSDLYIGQRRIAEILSTLDDSIEQTEALIAKHQQIKAGLMHDLFTRGVTPKGNLRPTREQAPGLYRKSPLGWIPREWQIYRVDDLCETASGGTPSRSVSEYWNGTIPWVKTGEIRYRLIEDTEEKITELGLKNSATRLLPRGTVVMALFGQGPTRGRVAILGIEATVNQACLAFIPNNTIDNHFLYYEFSKAYDDLRSLSNDGAQQNLNASLVRSFKIPTPDMTEQARIVQVLKSYDSSFAYHELYLDKLYSLKKGLMHDLLTGRVRVPVTEAEEDTA